MLEILLIVIAALAVGVCANQSRRDAGGASAARAREAGMYAQWLRSGDCRRWSRAEWPREMRRWLATAAALARPAPGMRRL